MVIFTFCQRHLCLESLSKMLIIDGVVKNQKKKQRKVVKSFFLSSQKCNIGWLCHWSTKLDHTVYTSANGALFFLTRIHLHISSHLQKSFICSPTKLLVHMIGPKCIFHQKQQFGLKVILWNKQQPRSNYFFDQTTF